jgi:hypothetical protein
MSFASQSEAILAVMRAMPYPNQITDIDLTEGTVGAVRLTWRGQTFRVALDGSVDEVIGACLYGNNSALLLEGLIAARRHP